MIKQLRIKGYKSIQDQTIELNPVNILIGGNGAGKSNFISIFAFIRHLYEGNLQRYVLQKGGADSLLYGGKKHTTEIDLDILFLKDQIKNRFLVSLGEYQDSLYIKSLKTAFYLNKWHIREYETDKLESTFRDMHEGQAYWVNDLLQGFEVYHFHDAGDKSPMKGKCNIDDNRYLKRDGSNIAAFLYYLKIKHPHHFLRIEKTIHSVAPFFESFILEPSRLNESQIQLEWKDTNVPDAYFNAYNLSDGTLRFICLVTLLMQPQPPKTIIIDEPELGLHPVAINKLAGLIRKVADEVQIIISTQSVNLLDNFESGDVIVADKEQGSSVFKRLNTEELGTWLEDYSLGEIWEKNIIGGQPFPKNI